MAYNVAEVVGKSFITKEQGDPNNYVAPTTTIEGDTLEDAEIVLRIPVKALLSAEKGGTAKPRAYQKDGVWIQGKSAPGAVVLNPTVNGVTLNLQGGRFGTDPLFVRLG